MPGYGSCAKSERERKTFEGISGWIPHERLNLNSEMRLAAIERKERRERELKEEAGLKTTHPKGEIGSPSNFFPLRSLRLFAAIHLVLG